MTLRTCVHPSGCFVYGLHTPAFHVTNMRKNDCIGSLGMAADGRAFVNEINFPPNDVAEPHADPIFEIPNAFPFKGVTYIARSWAEAKAKDPASIAIPEPPKLSFADTIKQWSDGKEAAQETLDRVFDALPAPLRLAVARTSTDPMDLIRLARLSCEFLFDAATGRPSGLRYRTVGENNLRPAIHDHLLYETVANSRFLPDDYKRVMVLKPGVQGGSEIVGESGDTDAGGNAHVFEYLRRNSYIPWGHYAANMADDAVRYRVGDLTARDMTALRHLYYQRTYVRLAKEIGIGVEFERRQMAEEALENLRIRILEALESREIAENLTFTRTLWGWNFGFDYAPTGYRLHASHQQIHQQFALIPATAAACGGDAERLPSYACGDMIGDFIQDYRQKTGRPFFGAYLAAIRSNRRMDGADNPRSLVIYEDENVMLFVPKAQTSQWEVQLMTVKPVGNVLEADQGVRNSLDQAMRLGVQALERMGAAMITSIEYSKPFHAGADLADQRLLYAFLPRLPESPGAFSEAQLRWINGHYPEDFAEACRQALASLAIMPNKL